MSAIERSSGDGVTPAASTAGEVDMTAPLSPTEEAAIHALHPTLGGNAGLLTTGVPCRAVLLAVVPLDAQTPAGEEATGLILSVTIVGQPPYQARVGVHVPPAARHLLVAGRDLPAVAVLDGVESVMIDWPAALAEAAGGTAQLAHEDTSTGMPAREEKVALKPGDKRGAIAPATVRQDALSTRPSDEDLTELVALVTEMNELHLSALKALEERPDACAELSARWEPLFARAEELMLPVKRPTS